MIKWWICSIILYFLYNHCIETNFNKFLGIANLEEDTPNIRNQHQRHQGETQSQMHHCISMRLIAYKCICLFAYHYHVRVSFLRHFKVIIAWIPACITITLMCIQKLQNTFTGSPQMAIQYFSHKIHVTHFMRHCTVALRDIFC